MLKRFFILSVLLMLLVSCAPTLDVASLQVMPEDKEKVEKLPKDVYVGKDWNVGVIEFENRTGIGPSRSTIGSYEQRSAYVKGGAAGIVATPGAIGVGYAEAGKSKTEGNFSVTQTEVIPKIGGVAAQVSEEVLISLGGVKVYSRDSLSKIFDEQKLQASGMIDENTMVKLGQLAGLTHIVTGSVNNVKMEYGISTGGSLGTALLSAYTGKQQQATPRWRVDIDTTIKVISVETGKVEFSKSFTAVETADGNKAETRPEFFLGLAQAALKEAIMRSQYELVKMFPLRAYIQQLRGGKKAALLNVGHSQGVKQGDKFYAYTFETIEDPVTGEKKLSKYKVAELTVTNQVTENSAWAVSEEKTMKNLKLGMLVEKAIEKGAFQKLKEGTEFLK